MKKEEIKPYEIINHFYINNNELKKSMKEEDLKKLYKIIITHSKSVMNEALRIAKNVPELNPDLDKIYIGALLHDIGIFKCNYPQIYCFGKEPYIKHGIIGGKLLKEIGLEKYASFCENHIGVGITKEDIIKFKLPLPKQDFTPKTVEEEIVCLADNFYSKRNLYKRKTIPQIKRKLKKFREDKVKRFQELLDKYKVIN